MIRRNGRTRRINVVNLVVIWNSNMRNQKMKYLVQDRRKMKIKSHNLLKS